MPSEDTQFKKGQSGNPSGRPKGTKSIKDMLRQALALTADIKELGPNNKESIKLLRQLETKFGGKITKEEMLYHVLTNRALSGDLKAIDMIFERREGKATQYNVNENVEMGYEDFLEKLKKESEE